MKPTSYTQEGDKITYHYTFKELREFLEFGFKHGNNGLILISQDKHFTQYKGFGTINNPWRYIANISIEHDPMYDGKRDDPEKIINPPETDPFDVRLIIWDASEHNDKKLPIKGEFYKDDEE